MIDLDRRHAIAVDTRSFGRRPGTMEEAEFVLPAPEHMGTDVVHVRPGSEMHLSVRLESVVDGILATGSVGATATGTCVRCLEDLSMTIDEYYQELYVWPGSVRDSSHPSGEVEAGAEEDEVRELEGDLLDLEPAVRDAVVTALPFQPVCSPDCPGLCDQCGARLVDDPDHHHDVIDPRWSSLADLAGPTADDEKRN